MTVNLNDEEIRFIDDEYNEITFSSGNAKTFDGEQSESLRSGTFLFEGGRAASMHFQTTSSLRVT